MNIQDFDVRAWLDNIHVPYWEAGPNVSRGWIGIQCPYCTDHANHGGINLVFKNFSCWLCPIKSSLVDLVCDLEEINYGAALDRVDEFQNFTPEEVAERERLEDVGQSVLPLGCRPLSKTHGDFLARKRKFDPKRLVRDWGLVSAPVVGPWRHRIIIPVVVEDRVMTFVGMDHTGQKEPKYKAASIEESFMPTSEIVYGADYAGRNALLVEGVTDVWRIGKGAVATFGMTPGPKRVRHLLGLHTEQFYVLFDGEEQATNNAAQLVADLRAGGKQADALAMQRGFDPDMLTAPEVADLRADLKLDA